MSTRWMRAVGAAALAIVVAVAVAGCGSAPAADDPTPGQTQTSAAVASPTKTPADQAADNAVAVWRGFLAAEDQLGNDPSVPLTLLADFAADPQLSQDLQVIQANRTSGYVRGGSVIVHSAETSKFSTVSDPSTTPPTYPSIHVTGCYDSVAVTLDDASGNSVQVPNRQMYGKYDATVSNADYPAADNWRVSNLTVTPVDSCDTAS